MSRARLPVGAVALICLVAGAARAQPPPAVVDRAAVADPRAERLAQLLAVHAAHERRERLLRGSVGVGIGALQVGVGALLLTDRAQYGETVPLSGWMNVGVGSYTLVRAVVNVALRGPLERLRDSVAERAAAGALTSGELARLEVAWEAAASKARKWRYANGVIYLAGGLACLGYGAHLLFSPPLADPVQEGQYIVGASVGVAGLVYATSGVFDLVLPSPVESALRAYKTGVRGPSLQPIGGAVPGGAVAGLAGTF